jgi:hypothetical protein
MAWALNTCHFKEILGLLINNGCLNKSSKKLIEDSYAYIGTFVKQVDPSFYEANPK